MKNNQPNNGNIPPVDKFERNVTPMPLETALQMIFNHINKVIEMVNEIKAKSQKPVLNFEEGGVPINIVHQIADVRAPKILGKSKSIIIPPSNGEPLLDPIKDKEIIDALLKRKDDEDNL